MCNLTYKTFKSKTNITEDKLEKLINYLNLIKKWQKKFNLISKNSFSNIWQRHFLDSYQILNLVGNKIKVLDIGSGAGFPAIVCAICSDNIFHLVDSNKKKCLFLNEVKKKIKLKNIVIHNLRIEDLKLKTNFNFITSRAVASVEKLLKYSSNFHKKKTNFILLKGKTVENEVLLARKKYLFQIKFIKSITDKEGNVLIIKNVKKK